MIHVEHIIPIVKLSLCDYIDEYILVSGTLTITGAVPDDAIRVYERQKGIIFKNCSPFTDCISGINTTQIDNAKYRAIIMPMYNLIEYSNNYSKTSGSLWQYYRNEPNDNITNLNHSNLR